jgi:predicted nucleotidyltransferase
MIDLEAARRVLDAWGHANPHIRVLLIYGSYAKGTATPKSDLDVAVVIAPADEEDAFTTWTAESDKWTEEIRALLGFRGVDLQWGAWMVAPRRS